MAKALLQQLQERGLLQQSTGIPQLQALLDAGPQVIYTGYDPTGASLHVGHLVTLMLLRRLHAAGHHVVALVGGGTALVGDPSHKSTARPMLSPEAVEENGAAILAQMQGVLGSGERLVACNNAAWLKDLNYLEFLREVGRHFSVNRMLGAEAYKSRLETGLSFLEFNYQLLQAYDFLHLARTRGCLVQVGGDDQWSNILAGIELCRRSDKLDAHGLTVPLLTTANGAKMGKTASGAVWLDPNKLHPNDFFQYWVNVDDRDVAKFLRIFTDLPMDQIDAAQAFNPNAQKRILAHEVTALVHGPMAAEAALAAAAAAFGAVELPAELLPQSRVARQLEVAPARAPSVSLAAAMGPGPWPLPLVLQHLGWVKTNNEARRLVAQGAVKLAALSVTDLQFVVTAEALPEAGAMLQSGKKKRIILLP